MLLIINEHVICQADNSLHFRNVYWNEIYSLSGVRTVKIFSSGLIDISSYYITKRVKYLSAGFPAGALME